MVLVAATCVAVPLWRARSGQRPSTDSANRAVHAARVEELDHDLAVGRLAPKDYTTARRDLDTELDTSLREAQSSRVRSTQAHGNRLASAALAMLMIVVVGVLYWQLGNWRAGVEGVKQASVYSVEQMVAQLAHRLHTTDRDDLQGWEMLGHAYLLMGRYAEAADAYTRARALSNDGNADVLASYGEAVTLANPDEFMSKALPAFERALQLDPSNPQALWYGGLGALERGDKTLALSRWRSLLAQNPPPEYRTIIEHSIGEAGGEVTPAKESNAPVPAANIHVRVTLDSDLRGKVSPDETLFVFAEPIGQSGGPPLAVRRFQVRDLPLDLTLSNSDSMIAGHNLSDYPKVNIIARISKGDTPVPKSGDLTGNTVWRVGDKTAIDLRIRNIIP